MELEDNLEIDEPYFPEVSLLIYCPIHGRGQTAVLMDYGSQITCKECAYKDTVTYTISYKDIEKLGLEVTV